MNRKSLPMLTMFAFLLFSTVALSIVTQAVYAQDLSSTTDIRVNHLVKAYDGGFVTINDTVTLTRKTGEQPPLLRDFQLGFPHEYKFKLYRVSAYEAQTPQQKLELELDTGLGTAGFYGVKVHFKSDVNLTSSASFSFTVIYEFSDLVTESIAEVFLLDFPVYPSLTQEASVCSASVILPPNANYTSSSHPFNQTASGTLVLEKKPLAAFTLEKGKIRFEPEATFSLLGMGEVKRRIVLNEWNELFVSDLYAATNKASKAVSTVWALLPKDASDISVKDDIGNTLTFEPETLGDLTKVTITLKYSIPQNQTAFFLVSFKLPWKDYVAGSSWSDYVLSFKLFEPMNMTVNKVTVTVELPEGAGFQSSTDVIQFDMVQNGIFSKAAVFSQNNVSSYQDTNFTVKYSHPIFWSSFRITLWTGALVTIVGAVAIIWQTRKAPTITPVSTALPIHPEELRNYVKTYEEQRKLLKERESLDAQARKGKVPRRLYKVRSRTIESRLTMLSRDMAKLRDKIRSAGPRYADMMRQIEITQTELQGVEADIKRTEARYKRGEISAAAYHKLLEDYFKRRDRAQTNTEGILLRLREEVS